MEMSIFIDISGEHSNVEAVQEPFHTLSVEIRTNPPYFQNASEPPKSDNNLWNACELLKSEKFVRKQQLKQYSVIYSRNVCFHRHFS